MQMTEEIAKTDQLPTGRELMWKYLRQMYLKASPSIDIDTADRIDYRNHVISKADFESISQEFSKALNERDDIDGGTKVLLRFHLCSNKCPKVEGDP